MGGMRVTRLVLSALLALVIGGLGWGMEELAATWWNMGEGAGDWVVYGGGGD